MSTGHQAAARFGSFDPLAGDACLIGASDKQVEIENELG